LSGVGCHRLDVPDAYYFGRRDDSASPKTPRDSLFRCFHVHCQHCGSYNVKPAATFDEDAGEAALVLVCGQCRRQEKIPV
jgi:hypothetical protein